MTTSERLERMTNRGEFEILANAVLRRAKEDYASLIDLGINVQGETIPAPTDGFFKIPHSDPPHFVWVQHTTTDRSNLRAKWLRESDEKLGDLIKASHRATQRRVEHPDAQFTVVLSTNQQLDEDLVADAYHTARELGIELDIWHVGRYADFLDNEPVGQHLRRQHLCIDAELLSADLLAELGRMSLDRYAQEEFQFTSPDLWVARELDARLIRSAENPGCHLVLLMGEPGFGKSAAAYRFVDKHVAAGGHGLRVPEWIAQGSLSLDDMLRQTLKRLHPTLASEEAARIPEIIPPNSRFLILVDDVNRVSNPPVLLRKLAGWSEPPYLIVCPVYARFRAQLADFAHMPDTTGQQSGSYAEPIAQRKERERSSSAETVLVDRMRPEEASRAIQAVAGKAEVAFSLMQADSMAARLGYDPFLIGEFGRFLQDTPIDQPIDTLDDNVLAQSIGRRISETLDGASAGQRFHHEYKEALVAVTSCMLDQRELSPSWTEVQSWLQQAPDHLDALRDLRHHGRLCRISAEDEFRFLHDRFRQHFCVEAIGRLLDDVDANAGVLSDPAYAEWVAQALVRVPQDEDVLSKVQDRSPLALVSTIKYMGVPSTEYHRLIVTKVGEWVHAFAGRYNFAVPESLRWAVAISFLFTDSPAVLDIVNTDYSLQYKTWLGGFARFRNGDPRGALEYCSLFGLRREQDGYLFNQLVEHAALHHRDQLVRGLADVLRSARERPDIDGAPILAGFLGFAELHDDVAEWWRGVSDRPKYLVEALWAALRCSEEPREDEFLDSVITYWAELLDVAEVQRASRRENTGERLCAGLPPCVNDALLHYLIEQADRHEVLRVPIARICCRIDLPDAIEFALRTSAESPEQERLCGAWSWPSVFGTKLSRASVARLHELWIDAHNSEPLRSIAFGVWLRNVDRRQVDVVEATRTLALGDTLFEAAIWERARLGDRKCVPDLVSILESDTSFFQAIHGDIWCDAIAVVTDKHLYAFRDNIPSDFSGGTQDPHWHLADLLMRIPVNDAESLLVKHWEHLRCSPLFVQSALYVGTPKCLELAGMAITEYPEECPLFKVVSFRFGFLALGKSNSLTLDHLKRVGQYWSRLDEHTLGCLADTCYQFGDEGIAWCREHLPESINETYRLRYCSTDDDLTEMLDRRVGFSETSTVMWVDDLTKHIDPPRLMNVLRRWLESEPTSQKVQVAATCIERVGQRRDLDMLDTAMERVEHGWVVEPRVESVKFDVRRRTLQ